MVRKYLIIIHNITEQQYFIEILAGVLIIMVNNKQARMERVGGSAMPVTMANASQIGVKGIVSETLKISVTKLCFTM